MMLFFVFFCITGKICRKFFLYMMIFLLNGNLYSVMFFNFLFKVSKVYLLIISVLFYMISFVIFKSWLSVNCLFTEYRMSEFVWSGILNREWLIRLTDNKATVISDNAVVNLMSCRDRTVESNVLYKYVLLMVSGLLMNKFIFMI